MSSANDQPPRRGHPSTSLDYEYTADEVEFATALDRFKRKNGRPFPTCSEVLSVLRSLGYRKVEPPAALP